MAILIAGVGIGGVTAALNLHAAGMADVQVLEASPSTEAVVVGINLPPHATRELTELGLAEKLAQLGIQTSQLHRRRAERERGRQAPGDAGACSARE